MIVQNKNEEKTCCFYVSEFHLEMLIVPYIREKINQKIYIISEKNLRKTIEILISRLNINEEEKEKILQLNWDGEEKNEENCNVIIIGSKKFIEEKNAKIEKMNILSVLDCYDFEQEKDNMNDIIKQYKKKLNTLGKSII